MADTPDFEIAFGKDRYLKGNGPYGLVALAIVVCAFLAALVIGLPVVPGADKIELPSREQAFTFKN